MKLDIIGISGKAGSGKDTLGKLVFERRGYHPFAFAWPLKMAALSAGFTYDDVFNVKPPQVREWLQTYGVRKRGQNPEYWVAQADGWLRTLYLATGRTQFVFTDVRFPNEAEYIRSRGGKLIRMEHGFGMPNPLEGTDAETHISETALDEWNDWDAVIRNDIHGNPELSLTMAAAKAVLIRDFAEVYG